MKGLKIEDGLLLTEMKVDYNGTSLQLSRVLVDTCATASKLTPETASQLNIPYASQDAREGAKFSTAISVGPLKIADFSIEVSPLRREDLDAVLGLDFLKRVGAKINLDSMTLSGSRVN
ncbi:MAG: aspartyl protease family protein [Bacillus sp. (in: Bacteria)]|nr:aspartyl protease family protein [Bacillus sp. (in: firmicutes)]